MADNKDFVEEEIEVLEYTLTDEEGNESKFELIGKIELDGNEYVALLPVDDDTEALKLQMQLRDRLNKRLNSEKIND